MSKENRHNPTYHRIINASLQLFNEQGERNISTNHIAGHLGISPGNLYYHFANKDEIIIQLFKRYSLSLLEYLQQTPLPVNISETATYMAGIYDIMWQYRFLFSDVNTLLTRSAALLGEHNAFTQERFAPLAVKLLTRLQENGIIRIDETGIHDLSLNMWILTKYWFDFDSSIRNGERLDEQSKKRGICRTLSLLRPYLQPEHLPEFDAQTAILLSNAE